MEKEKSLFEQMKESEMKRKLLGSVIQEIAESTEDTDFKCFNLSIKIQDKLNDLRNMVLYKCTVEEKNKIITFYEQINNLLDDFCKEMNIHE